MRLRRAKRFRLSLALSLALSSPLVLRRRAASGSDDDDDSRRAARARPAGDGDDGGGGVRDRHRELHDRPEHRRDHRRHDQDRHEPAAVGHLRRVLRDPEGRAGVHRLPQRRQGRRRRSRGKKYKIELVAKDDAYDGARRRSRTCSRSIDDDKVFGLFNVVGTKNNLAIRDTSNEDCVPNLFAATGSPAWGNHDYPWLLGTELVPYPLEMQALVDYLEGEQARRDDRGPARRRRLRRVVLRDAEGARSKGTDLTIVGRADLRPRDR